MHANPATLRVLLAPAALFLLASCIYLPSLSNDFVHYDDFSYIQENPAVTHPSWIQATQLALSQPYEQNFAPGLWLTFRILFQTVGFESSCFHAVSAVFHGLTTILVFSLAQRFRIAPALAAGVALVWALHPQRVEAISWASGLKEPASALFALITTHLWFAGLNHSSKTQRSLWIALASVTSFLLSLSFKQTPFPLPFALIAWRILSQKRQTQVGLFSEIGLCVSAILAVVLVSMANSDAVRQGSYLGFSSALQHIPHSLSALGWISLKTLFPIGLIPDYAVPKKPNLTLSLGLVVCLLSLALFIYAIRTKKHFVMLGLLVAGSLWLPVSGILSTPLEFTADRLTYLPAAFLLIGLSSLYTQSPPLPNMIVLFGIPIGILALLTVSQQAHWANDRSLFAHALKHTPHHYPSLINQAVILAHEDHSEAAKNSLEKAIIHYPLRNGAYEALIRLHLSRQQRGLALQAAKRWTERIPLSAIAYYYHATLLELHERFEQAYKSNQQGLIISPKSKLLRQQKENLEKRFSPKAN